MRKLVFLTPLLIGLLVMMACGDRVKSIIDDIQSPQERYTRGDSMLIEQIQGSTDRCIAIYYQGPNLRNINVWDSTQEKFIVDTYVKVRGDGEVIWSTSDWWTLKHLNDFATPISSALVKTLPVVARDSTRTEVGHPTRTEPCTRVSVLSDCVFTSIAAKKD